MTAKLKRYCGDLHIHSLLSPCAEVEMTPHHILMRARQNGINLLAITDHNASANVIAAWELAESYGISVLPGMEVECSEEAHLLAIFDNMESMYSWQKFVDEHHGGLENKADFFGAQFVVDAADNFVREEKRMLLAPLTVSAEVISREVQRRGGLVIAAHIDRPSYSILGSLGFIGDNLEVDAVEISRHNLQEIRERKLAKAARNLPYVLNSDAHRICDFINGPKTEYLLAEATVKEIKLALAGEKGRSFRCIQRHENGYKQI